MNITLEDHLNKLTWSLPKVVETKYGMKTLRSTAPTEDFWELWNQQKDAVKKLGVSVGKDFKDDSKWVVNWWTEPPAGMKERLEKNIAQSTSVDAIDDIAIPCPDGLAYRPYQRGAIAFARDKKGVMLADEMGLGKSVETIGIINADETIKKALIVCPVSLKLNWQMELTRWLVRPMTIGIASPTAFPGFADIVIVGDSVLSRFVPLIEKHEWDLAVIDECFPAGTLVKTPNGYTPIEQVQVGDMVANAIGYGRVRWKKESTPKSLVKVKTTHGAFTCTPAHLVLTDEGWIMACQLNNQHCIKTYDQTMRLVQSTPEGNSVSETVLQSILLCEVENETAISKGQGVHTATLSQKCSGHAEASRGTPRVGSHAESKNIKESTDGQPEVPSKTEGHIQATEDQANDPWWERDWIHEGRGCAVKSSAGNYQQLPSPDSGSCSISPPLQSGRGNADHKTCNRDGRQFTQGAIKTGSRHPQNRHASEVRVVRVEIQKQAGDPSTGHGGCHDKVYNLEVDGHPSYVITESDLVVHNCSRMKNRKAARTKAMHQIKARRRLALSGTPMENNPQEIFEPLSWVDPIEFGNFFKFVTKYCGARKVGFGFAYSPTDQDLQNLQRRLRESVMIRRLKSEVAKDIPPKTRSIVTMECHDRAIQEEMAGWKKYEPQLERIAVAMELAKAAGNDAEFTRLVEEMKGARGAAFEEMAAVRKRVAEIKLPFVLDLIENQFIENRVKLVTFGHHRFMIEAIEEKFGKLAVTHYGGMSEAVKFANVQAFQNDPDVLVFNGSLLASGMGITLTAATNALCYEYDWRPGIMNQAEDRIHRIGQLNPVNIHLLVLQDSLDAYQVKTYVAKAVVIGKALDGPIAEAEDKGYLQMPDYVPVKDKPHVSPKKEALIKLGKELPAEMRPVIHRCLGILAGMDTDHARDLNGIGFSKIDVRIGHSLAQMDQLSPGQAALGWLLCRKYRRQLPPDTAEFLGIAAKETTE